LEEPLRIRTDVNKLIGQRFHRLVVLSFAGRNKWGRALYLCRCDCGTEKIINASYLQKGNTKSCGCLVPESSAKCGHKRKGVRFEQRPLAERFWSKVNKIGLMPTVCSPSFGNCWLWTGSKNKQGYGSLGIDANSTVHATHVAWFLEYGIWPEQDMCHVCDNEACVRFNHLFDADAATNAYDRCCWKDVNLTAATVRVSHKPEYGTEES
jgi:hypothetical protein